MSKPRLNAALYTMLSGLVFGLICLGDKLGFAASIVVSVALGSTIMFICAYREERIFNLESRWTVPLHAVIGSAIAVAIYTLWAISYIGFWKFLAHFPWMDELRFFALGCYFGGDYCFLLSQELNKSSEQGKSES